MCLYIFYRIFDGLRVTKKFTGQIIFLEEDHYVTPDILYTLNKLTDFRNEYAKDSSIIALGNYNKLAPNTYKNTVSCIDNTLIS